MGNKKKFKMITVSDKQSIISDINDFEEHLLQKYGIVVTLHITFNAFSLEEIINAVNEVLFRMHSFILIGTSGRGIKDKSRQRELSTARQVYYKIARDSGYAFNRIGAVIERDHATVMHQIKRFDDLMATDDEYTKSFYNEVIKHLPR